ncbi:hypothetical protein CO169_00565 [Candidatus Shapirobacteria bacterium CG_4_9_14_3_um_filter_39_13]|uniref:Membrane protein 6-pyruvoyl-tetrahydropterin synthase-related domain-containing protein n=1 Tax=Candidatus Shapirobacteria bacterium CG_4_9_14_3_um_filter_39_13 TaxID=1974479 RepID=A0A2M7XM36_9BACT|nr:MAG: hypothetical protein CO169_00565 [Candidatus Shapirobacteria bacterium CG_4_9_14_3_um_filter_39_13]
MRIFAFNKKKIIEVLFLLAVILSVIPIIIPFFHKGFFPTHDDVQVGRIFEMFQALKYGSFPPRWASGLLFGHGYPLFVFYSPLTYYLGALLVFAGANFLVATKIVFLMAFFLGAIAMYLLVKEMFGRLPGLVASVLFSYAPYKAVDVYVRGNLPEFLSLSLFPLVLWFNWRLLKSKNSIWLPLFALSLALLFLTHNISFVIFSFFLAVFNLVIILGQKEKKEMFIKAIGGGLLALLISSFFWAPLLAETKLVKLSSQPWPLSYDKFFLTYKQLWSSPWGFNGFHEPQPMSLQIGKTFIVFSILAFLIGLFRKYDLHKKAWLFFSGFFFFSVFMTTFPSNFIWKALPFLAFFQFPWRFHILITFCGSVLIATIVYYLGQIMVQKKWAKILVGLVALMIIGLVVFENYRFFKPKLYWEPLAVSETTTWDDEYLPVWVKVKPKDYEGEKVKVVEGEGEIKEINWGYLEKDFIFLAKKESVVELAHIYYPGWKAFVNGEEEKIDYGNERGLMKLKLSEGQNLVKFKFLRTPLRLTSEIASLIGLLITGFLLAKSFRGKNKKTKRKR